MEQTLLTREFENKIPEKPTYQQLQERIAELESEVKRYRKSLLVLENRDLSLEAERFRLAFYTSPDAINICSVSDGSYIDVNEGFTKLTGYTREEILAEPKIHVDIWHDPKDREYLLQVLKTTGHVKNLEARFITKEGVVIHGLLSARVIKIKNEKAMLSITRDITDIRLAQQKIAESEKRLRAFIENSPDIFFVHDRQGNITQINEQACRSWGYARNELVGRSILDIELALSKETVIGHWQRVIEGEVFDFEGNQRRKDGNTFPTEVKLSAVHFNGEAFIFGFARDISERKALEAEKEMIQQRLNLVQRLQAIGTLAGGVAHDFNNLLMGIQGCASLMLYHVEQSHPCYKHVKNILECSRSAANLTRQLLGIARGGKYEVKPIDLNAVLVESATLFGRTRKQIQIHTKLHEPAPVGAVDHKQIEQVLLNLFVNARQAMPDGGQLYLQTAVVKPDDHFCKAYSVKPGPFAKLSITDTGIGMEQTVLQQIFDPFFTTKEKSRGTGLGLASAYGIIKNHGGIIIANSEPGHGATFDIYLPLSEEAVKKNTQTQEGLEKGTETILLVDDEQIVLDVGRAMLKKLNYKVIGASSGETAIDMLKNGKQHPDLVILDLVMPGMNGEKAFEAIRAINPAIPILLASGYTLDGQASHVMDKGCNGFIQKPFNLEDLSQKVRQIISEERSQ